MQEPRSKTHLREFQARLSERLRRATSADMAARLGLLIGDERYLVDLSEAGEIVAIPSVIAPVPRTRDWFRGLVNLRGVLFAVSDLSRLAGRGPTPLTRESRLLAVAGRLNFNAAILVSRMLGLHNIGAMRPDGSRPADPEQPWHGRRMIDNEGRHWTELSLVRLITDERFLMVNR